MTNAYRVEPQAGRAALGREGQNGSARRGILKKKSTHAPRLSPDLNRSPGGGSGAKFPH